jgi:hypothetical protein
MHISVDDGGRDRAWGSPKVRHCLLLVFLRSALVVLSLSSG